MRRLKLVNRSKQLRLKPLATNVSIEYGFRTYKENSPIYIAEKEEVIVGFACYDVVRGKKGLFGPMGTAKQNRVKGVGRQLLHPLFTEYEARRI
ncbi:acetyltransferase, GNAT family [Bacillus cereus]|nr:acetyltransferase, GNAT family [Bacillus cereus]